MAPVTLADLYILLQLYIPTCTWLFDYNKHAHRSFLIFAASSGAGPPPQRRSSVAFKAIVLLLIVLFLFYKRALFPDRGGGNVTAVRFGAVKRD